MTCVIYDFETLGQDQRRSVVVSLACLAFDEDRYISNPYTYEELVESSKYIKFDVEDQVKNWGRQISKSTLDWWNEQGEEAKKQLRPSPNDRPIVDVAEFISQNFDCKNIKKSFTRGNTFDTMFLQYLYEDIGKEVPFHWRTVRDTRSMIDGMTFGTNIENTFMPRELKSKFVHHDPRHDIAMDVMRMQIMAQMIAGTYQQ